MPVAVYGHYGFVLLLVPTAAADFLEYERFGLMESIRPFIEGGKLKVYSVNSISKYRYWWCSMNSRSFRSSVVGSIYSRWPRFDGFFFTFGVHS